MAVALRGTRHLTDTQEQQLYILGRYYVPCMNSKLLTQAEAQIDSNLADGAVAGHKIEADRLSWVGGDPKPEDRWIALDLLREDSLNTMHKTEGLADLPENIRVRIAYNPRKWKKIQDITKEWNRLWVTTTKECTLRKNILTFHLLCKNLMKSTSQKQ